MWGGQTLSATWPARAALRSTSTAQASPMYAGTLPRRQPTCSTFAKLGARLDHAQSLRIIGIQVDVPYFQ
jgi:hypothetical protein